MYPNSVSHKICEAEGPFGVRSVSVPHQFEFRSGSVRGFVRGSFGVRSGQPPIWYDFRFLGSN